MTTNKERLEILEMIQRGTISAEEGLKLIEALDETEKSLSEEYLSAKAVLENTNGRVESDRVNPLEGSEDFSKWRKWWIIPFWIGVGITVLGGSLMYWAWSARGFGAGFFLAWIPFLVGLSVLVLGWNRSLASCPYTTKSRRETRTNSYQFAAADSFCRLDIKDIW